MRSSRALRATGRPDSRVRRTALDVKALGTGRRVGLGRRGSDCVIFLLLGVSVPSGEKRKSI